MRKTYVFRRPIAFGDVDQAKILFYPAFFRYCHEALEGFAADALGISYAVLMNERHVGFPTVHIDADYRRPFPYGVDIEIGVTLKKIGVKSVEMNFCARVPGDAEPRVTATITKVAVDMRTFESLPIPDWIRGPYAAYLENE